MSSEQRIFLPPSSPLSAGALEPLAGLDPLSSPQTEMDSLRLFVTERLTAAVDDILGVFVKTVTRYRDHIDRQQRQLDRLRTEENLQRTEENLLRTEENLLRTEENLWSHEADPVQTPSWIKPCPDDQPPSAHTDGAEAAASGPSAAQIKTEAGAADCGESDPNCDFDPAAGFDAVSDGRLPADCSETEDSGDYWREAAGLWRAEETEEPGGQSSSDPSHQPSPLFTCKVCGESFHRISYLLTHASAHLRDCGLCGKHLDQTENLKLHLRVHREASFRCGVCGQSFTLRGNLRTHMRIHTGERPYSCTVCGKSFGRRATLVRHVRSHTGEKPFVCSYCGRGFVEKGNLTVHLRTHTGEKPYWCSLCDRRFSQLSCFYKHPCQRRGLNTDCPKS